MATPVQLGALNGFLPAETSMAISYVRDPSKFQLLNYVQLVNCPKPRVRYAFLDPDEAVRLPDKNAYRWGWGQPRPKSQGNKGNFKWVEVEVDRYTYDYTIDENVIETVEGWNPKAFYDEGILSKAMTNCTNIFVDLMEATSTWGSNYAAANSLNGGAGYWSTASSDETSSSFLAIKKTLDAARNRIVLGTNGAVSPNDMKLILSPDTAIAMSNTSEIHSYMRSTAGISWPIIQGTLPGKSMDTWSLPQKLYGMEVIVEDAPIATNLPDSSGTVSTVLTEKVYAKDKTSAVVCSRPGGLDGRYLSSNFSTFQKYFWKYEMRLSTFHDKENELYNSYCDDCFKAVCPAPQSGFLITGVMPA